MCQRHKWTNISTETLISNRLIICAESIRQRIEHVSRKHFAINIGQITWRTRHITPTIRSIIVRNTRHYDYPKRPAPSWTQKTIGGFKCQFQRVKLSSRSVLEFPNFQNPILCTCRVYLMGMKHCRHHITTTNTYQTNNDNPWHFKRKRELTKQNESYEILTTIDQYNCTIKLHKRRSR